MLPSCGGCVYMHTGLQCLTCVCCMTCSHLLDKGVRRLWTQQQHGSPQCVPVPVQLLGFHAAEEGAKDFAHVSVHALQGDVHTYTRSLVQEALQSSDICGKNSHSLSDVTERQAHAELRSETLMVFTLGQGVATWWPNQECQVYCRETTVIRTMTISIRTIDSSKNSRGFLF